jgi:hypothetical protein
MNFLLPFFLLAQVLTWEQREITAVASIVGVWSGTNMVCFGGTKTNGISLKSLNLPNGIYTVRVCAVDKQGLISDWSDPIEVEFR